MAFFQTAFAPPVYFAFRFLPTRRIQYVHTSRTDLISLIRTIRYQYVAIDKMEGKS